MVDFRKWFPALAIVAVVLGSAGTARAQFTPSLNCFNNAGATPTVRAEGISEAVGDVVLNCTGGVPTPAGQPVPQVNIVVFLNTNITSRLVGDPYTEALILIDDPAPSQQIPCIPGTTAGSTATTCPITGTGAATGVNYRGGTVPNIFQSRTTGQANAVQWLGVPIDPPGTNGTRIVRITNVRANANQLGTSTTLIPTQIQMLISVTPSQALPINNPQQTVAFVQNGLSFSLRKADNSGSTSGITFLQCNSVSKDTANDSSKALSNGISFIARFSEGFASSFKRRNVAPLSSTGAGAAAFNADVSPTPTNQDSPGGVCPGCPGGLYYTETDFYAGGAGGSLAGKANGLGNAGLADFGTRLMLRFQNVPAGAQVFVGLYELVSGGTTTATTATNSRLRLVSTDAFGNGSFTPVSSTNTTGGMPYAPVTITNGAGVAVYEVMNSDPTAPENMDVPIAVAFASNTATPTPALGASNVVGSFAPLSTVTTISSSAPIPRFADVPKSATDFTINACSTNLLFPFVTNQAGFDTGIAIANTSLDPFKTATQQGACTINYYGNTTGGGAAPSAATSPVVPAGSELVFLLSSGGGGVPATPGFQGYIIAQCAFQYAHGFAFISDLGSQKLAEGYLALVMDSAIATRTGTSSETLGN